METLQIHNIIFLYGFQVKGTGSLWNTSTFLLSNWNFILCSFGVPIFLVYCGCRYEFVIISVKSSTIWLNIMISVCNSTEISFPIRFTWKYKWSLYVSLSGYVFRVCLLSILFAVVLRMISFGYDYHWEDHSSRINLKVIEVFVDIFWKITFFKLSCYSCLMYTKYLLRNQILAHFSMLIEW